MVTLSAAITCDNPTCNSLLPFGTGNPHKARALAKKEGWQLILTKKRSWKQDFCPKCRK